MVAMDIKELTKPEGTIFEQTAIIRMRIQARALSHYCPANCLTALTTYIVLFTKHLECYKNN